MIKKILLLSFVLLFASHSNGQITDPVITEWIFNTDNTTGQHYEYNMMMNTTTLYSDTYLANVESVHYTQHFSFISASGIPSYIVGPYLDGNPSLASDNGHIFKIPRVPAEETGTKTDTGLGEIGVFINGVPIYDYRDAQSYSLASGDDSGGGDGVWNRDAVLAEMDGFDCSKGHPSPIFIGGSLAGGTYHHHQNPSAFNLDLSVVSDVCDDAPSDGLYVINASEHSPLIGFAFDGYPVYGAYGYANANGTGGVTRIESSYQLRNITVRTEYADGTDVTDGPAVSSSFPLGHYKEDYEYIAGSGDLDEYNGRFAVTPEYPAGTYAYYATVDANHNSAFPYMIGPDSYYGVVTGGNVNSLPPPALEYLPIELLSFTASLEKDHTLVEWATSVEINNDFFTLEKSSDDDNFKEITRVEGAGDSEEVQRYDFKDLEMEEGICYYRLKQTDYDGTSSYIKIISVSIKGDFSFAVNTYPNPATDYITVQAGVVNKKDLEVKLFDSNGSLLKTDQIKRGSTMCRFDARILYNGEYMIQVSDGLNVETEKVMVMKE